MLEQALFTIEIRPWSGWTPEQSHPTTLHVHARAGQKINPNTLGITCGGFEITVESVEATQVVVTYRGVVMENSDGTIPLSAHPSGRQFLWLGRRLQLATPTMDAGTSIALTLDDIE
jgi:hypothetical protein